MGIEPTRAALPGLGNKCFGAMTDAKCDWRVNFRGMWGYLGLRRDTSAAARRPKRSVRPQRSPQWKPLDQGCAQVAWHPDELAD